MTAVFTIPPEAPFLDRLAHGLARLAPEDLARAIVLLPSRRACLELGRRLAAAHAGRAVLLPKLLPVGEPDLTLPGFLEAALDLPPAVAGPVRHLHLTRLVQLARAAAGSDSFAEAARLAVELGALLDELGSEGRSLGDLGALVEPTHAAHWELTRQVLHVVEVGWPAWLAERGLVDPGAHRTLTLDRLAAAWADRPPACAVVAAGITGSLPAVARLLATVARLPRGQVILPGLDRAIPGADWAALSPTHPQHALKRVLDLLDQQPATVPDWPSAAKAPAGTSAPPERAALWRRATAGAKAAAMDALSAAACRGIAVVDHADPAAEALDLAIRIREALEVPGRRVALVTADRTLARRVAADLARFDLAVPDGAGVPLDQTPVGTLLLLAARLVEPDASPSAVLAALKHPLVLGGLPPGEFRRQVRLLELEVLRGPRPMGGLAGIRSALLAKASGPRPGAAPALLPWFDRLRDAAAPLAALMARPAVPFDQLLQRLTDLVRWLAGDADGSAGALQEKAAGRRFAAWLAAIEPEAAALGDTPPTALPTLLATFMGGIAVPPDSPGDPRVTLLGRFESRLVQADLVLLGGLNEGVWPTAVETGPWLNRAMRAAIGLPPVEQAVGHAAHDLVMAAMAPEVVLSRARKDGLGRPTVPSRWLVRLHAALGAAGLRTLVAPAVDRLAWPRALDGLDRPTRPSPRPEPRPRRDLRPRRLPTTALSTLQRNPYEVYAQYVLGLKALEPLDAELAGRERGMLVHEALALFVRRHPSTLPPDPLVELEAIWGELVAGADARPTVRALWGPRFARLAGWVVAAEAERRPALSHVLAEVAGEWPYPLLDGTTVTLTGRADRIEVRSDGTVVIVDHKTTEPTAVGKVAAGLDPQLAVLGLMADEGGFAGLSPATCATLDYWQLTGQRVPGERRAAAGTKADAQTLKDNAREGLAGLLTQLVDPEIAFRPVPPPDDQRGPRPIDHLSRAAEWRGREPT